MTQKLIDWDSGELATPMSRIVKWFISPIEFGLFEDSTIYSERWFPGKKKKKKKKVYPVAN